MDVATLLILNNGLWLAATVVIVLYLVKQVTK